MSVFLTVGVLGDCILLPRLCSIQQNETNPDMSVCEYQQFT